MLLCCGVQSFKIQFFLLIRTDVDLDLNHDRPVFYQVPPFRASSVARAGHVGFMRHVTCVWGRFLAAAYFCFYYVFLPKPTFPTIQMMSPFYFSHRQGRSSSQISMGANLYILEFLKDKIK